jgi:AcrR family transcriptional regulator
MSQSEIAVLPSSAERLLDAAERLVAERGAAHLTLDAVAAEAGVSKGGLLYHFPTKAALLEGMIRRHLRDIDERAARHAATWSGTGKPPLAHVVAARMRAILEKASSDRAVGAAMLAAAAGNPALLEPCRQRCRESLDEMSALPVGFERAAILQLAVDGLLLGELLQMSPFTDEERGRVVAAILNAITNAEQPS